MPWVYIKHRLLFKDVIRKPIIHAGHDNLLIGSIKTSVPHLGQVPRKGSNRETTHYLHIYHVQLTILLTEINLSFILFHHTLIL